MDVAQLAHVEIPKTLDEAVKRLDHILDPNDRRGIAQTLKDDLVVNYHFGLGIEIRNAFKLHKGNPDLLASCGASHADDATTVILEALWTRLRKDPRNLLPPYRASYMVPGLEWGIEASSDGKYAVVKARLGSELVCTPGGHPVISESAELMAFIAASMNCYGESVSSAMSPYAIESSWIDFGISNENPQHVSALLSAYDECPEQKTITRDDWREGICKATPRNVAVMMCVCGNIGWPQVAYHIAVENLKPPPWWLQGMCGIRGYADGDPDLVYGAAHTNDAFGELALNLPGFQRNCRTCVRGASSFDDRLCAIDFQFSLICEYARYSKSVHN